MHHSALFWRIAACIFASVLLIEGVLLGYSWVTERNRMVSRVEISAQTLVSSLNAVDPAAQLSRMTQNPEADSELNVLSFVHRSKSGTVAIEGNLSNFLYTAVKPGDSHYDRKTNSIVTAHHLELTNGNLDTLYLRVDAAWIDDYMQKYVLRILGMISVITVFLTISCLLFLKPLLIDPLRRLERLLTFNTHTGFSNAAVIQKDSRRRDELGAVFRSFIELREKVTEAESKLEHLANHDELTGLANRRNMSDFLQARVKDYESHGVPSSLLMIDLDHFKEINDRVGHAAGDSVLKDLARILIDNTDDSAFIARQGGDEFALILPGTQINAAVDSAEHIRKSVENANFAWKKQRFVFSVSVGVAELSLETPTSESLIMAADNACIAAKRRGKNQVITHDNLLEGHEAKWINRILDSLKTNKFTLFRQSIVRINSELPSEHFEILLRMENPEGGFYSPGDFLPVAERNNLMPKIDRWVIDNAMNWLATQEMKPADDYCMNINISANSLAAAEFRDYLQEKVKNTTNINPYLCFEITESAAMTNYDETISLLQTLQENGCSVALDDFGTGFSSLAHIRELPLDYIKIDGCFVQHIFSNELDQTVVKSVADIAKVLKIKTVAEFVDNEESLQTLKDLEIDYAQGFYFSRPQALIEFEDDMDAEQAA